MRFDRGLTLCCFRFLFHNSQDRVPILMYHSVSNDFESGISPYYRVVTNPQRFAEQMQRLNESGYRGVSLEEVLAAQDCNPDNKQRLVGITFDDGFRDFFTTAWPSLQQHKFTATVYLPTAFISKPRRSFLNRECLTWDEVRDLRKQGVRFGSHTVNHPKLYELPWPEIKRELTQSKLKMEGETGEKIFSFAYPYAFPQEDRRFTSQLTNVLRESGYRSCVTTIVGRFQTGDAPFLIKRLPVNSCDDQSLFSAKLRGNYDWLGRVQSWRRRLKRFRRPEVLSP